MGRSGKYSVESSGGEHTFTNFLSELISNFSNTSKQILSILQHFYLIRTKESQLPVRSIISKDKYFKLTVEDKSVLNRYRGEGLIHCCIHYLVLYLILKSFHFKFLIKPSSHTRSSLAFDILLHFFPHL